MKIKTLKPQLIENFIKNNVPTDKNSCLEPVDGLKIVSENDKLYAVTFARDKINWIIIPNYLYEFANVEKSSKISVSRADSDGNVVDVSRDFYSFVNCPTTSSSANGCIEK